MIRLVLPLALCGAPVLACPTGDDLATGISVLNGEGAVEIYQTAGDGIVSQTIDWGDGEVAKNTLARGVYVLRLMSEIDGVLDFDSLLETSYDRPPAAMAPPKPGLVDSLRTTVTLSDGSYKETQEHVWGQLEPVTIGDCTYDSIKGEILYLSDQDTIEETVRYFPALGISVLTSYAYAGEPPDIYEIVAIEAVK